MLDVVLAVAPAPRSVATRSTACHGDPARPEHACAERLSRAGWASEGLAA